MRYIVASLAFCITFLGCGKGLRYILIDDTTSYTRVMFHEMYEQENIDVLFVGSSHCYRSFVPEILDEELGVNTFNAGTSGQDLDGSYMIIKEAARYNDIKHIYLELYYIRAFNVYKDRTNLTQTYIISDYIRSSLDKIQYLLQASSKEHYFNSFILARRNWNCFFNPDYVKDLVIKKATDTYRNYEYAYITGDSEWYVGKGYVANNGIINEWNYFSNNGWDSINFNNIAEDWINTLKKIIRFCEKNEIGLTLVTVPMPDYLIASLENYDEYIDFVDEIISDTEVDYYDFNLCREKYFPNTSTVFMDDNHMNCYGAEIFSHIFADFISNKILQRELFYKSYEEKIRNLGPSVLGISYQDYDSRQEKCVRKCKIVSTRNNLEYEITVAPIGKEPYKVQDFSENRFFELVPNENGVISIRYRLTNVPDEIQIVDISY